MKRAFHLAWSLIQIRHLSLSLFVFPLICSVLLVLGQLVVTTLFIRSVTPTVPTTEVIQEDFNPVRLVLYGSGERRPSLEVCRWVASPSDPAREVPPRAACAPDSLDVALNVSNPQTFDVEKYVEMFQGQIDRLHVCKDCRPDVVITASADGKHHSRAGSVYGLAVMSLAFIPKPEERSERVEKFKTVNDSIGDILFYMPDASDLVRLSSTNGAIPFAANIVPLVVIALWLSVRAHRKVLDYFSRNDVLLPLVAATGKRTFYSALWIVTSARVLCFLAASLPVVYFGLKDIGGVRVFDSLRAHQGLVVVWLFALVSAVALCTIVSSIADLKHRQAFGSILYRYVPILVALIGAFVWTASFIVPSPAMGVVRSVIVSIPLVGLAPLFAAPVTMPHATFVLIHAVTSTILVVLVLRNNARWFGAHLEEV
jgi:hypothetical protein